MYISSRDRRIYWLIPKTSASETVPSIDFGPAFYSNTVLIHLLPLVSRATTESHHIHQNQASQSDSSHSHH